MRDRAAKSAPGSPLAGYIAYREMSADYAAKMTTAKGDDIPKIQEAWSDKLKGFVDSYPTAEDAPDALNQLGMFFEFAGKEADAKKWYEVLAKNTEAARFLKRGPGLCAASTPLGRTLN